MNVNIRYSLIAVGFAVLIPLGISLFLIIQSYKLERKKFDIEITQLTAAIYYSFKGDYKLLDSIVERKIGLSADSVQKIEFDNEFMTDIRKVYNSYKDIGDSLRMKLQLIGYDVDLYRNGDSVIATLGNELFDLYILDVMLPDISGFEVARRIVDNYPRAPFLFLTAKKTKD